MAERRDSSWLEIVLLFGVLVGGAFLRYWLSTAVPFDASEFAALSDATVRTHAVRIPFIMFNGLSLFMLYVIARRSAGVAAAFALLLLLQTNVPFQEAALRIRWSSVLIFVALTAAAYLRFGWPPWRPPRLVSRALAGVVALLVVRGTVLIATLPAQLDAIRRETRADASAFYASLAACGGGVATPAEVLARCELAWPESRSLEQQEALLAHAQYLSRRATVLDGRVAVPDAPDRRVALYDAAGVALFVVEEGEDFATAQRVLTTVAATAR